MRVFAADSCNPRVARKASIHGLTSVSSNSFEAPVTIKSSAYRVTPTLSFSSLAMPHFARRWATSCVSKPFSVQFANAGLRRADNATLRRPYARCLPLPTVDNSALQPLSEDRLVDTDVIDHPLMVNMVEEASNV